MKGECVLPVSCTTWSMAASRQKGDVTKSATCRHTNVCLLDLMPVVLELQVLPDEELAVSLLGRGVQVAL